MEKSYTKNGINFKNLNGVDFFCPRENLEKMVEHEKELIVERQNFLNQLEADLKSIYKV